MEAVVVGATFVGSIVTAFFVQRAVLGAMLRAFGQDKGTPTALLWGEEKLC
jgi:hypothetical protein